MIENPYLGKFFAVEGINGSGKTTHSKMLAWYLCDSGRESVLASEPSRDIGCEERADMTPLERQEVFAKDRLIFMEEIVIPSLVAGKNVVVDRYFMSTTTYGMMEEMDQEDIFKINSKILGDSFLAPDTTFVLDISASMSMSRLSSRLDDQESIHYIEAMRTMRHKYLMLMQKKEPNVKLVDGDKDIPEVASNIWLLSEKILS